MTRLLKHDHHEQRRAGYCVYYLKTSFQARTTEMCTPMSASVGRSLSPFRSAWRSCNASLQNDEIWSKSDSFDLAAAYRACPVVTLTQFYAIRKTVRAIL